MQVSDKDLEAGRLSVYLPPQKLLRIKALDKDGKPAANKIVSYQNIREVPTAFYTVKTHINGEVLLCGVKARSYIVASPDCDPVGVVVERGHSSTRLGSWSISSRNITSRRSLIVETNRWSCSNW